MDDGETLNGRLKKISKRRQENVYIWRKTTLQLLALQTEAKKKEYYINLFHTVYIYKLVRAYKPE